VREIVRKLLLSPLPAFVLLGLAYLMFHEPWRDEAQPWLLVRDAPDLFHEMDSEGSPALWYLLLWPLVKLGLPFVAERVLHVALGSCALAAIVLWSPFSKLEQWLLAGSYLFAYEYLAIARGYVLTILALVALAAHHARRREHPWAHGALLLLLANTTGLGALVAAAFAAGCGLEALMERAPRRLAALWLPAAAGGALAYWQMRPAPDVAPWRNATVTTFRADSLVDLGRAVSHAFLPLGTPGAWAWNEAWYDKALGGPGLVALAALVWLVACVPLARSGRALGLWILASLALGALYYARSGTAGQMRHHGILFVTWLCCLWIARVEAPAPRPWLRRAGAAVLALALVVQVAGAAVAIAGDATAPFSGGPAVAALLESKGYVGPRTLVGVYPDFIAAPILAPLGKDVPRALFLQTGEMGSYVRWTSEDYATFFAPGHVEEKLAAAARNGTYDHVVLVMSVRSADEGRGWTLLAHVDSISPGDGMNVYEMDASMK
jgi:hypothetical protein